MALTKIPASFLDKSAHVDFADNERLRLGTDNDLQIYSDGTHSRIYESGSGLLIIRAGNFNINNADGSQSYITMSDGGATTLYHAGDAKLATTSTGASVTGNLAVSGNLTVSGTTTELDTTNLNVTDKNITLNYHASSDTSSNAGGAGITIQDAVDASNDATILWDASNDEFDFSHQATLPGLKLGVNTSIYNQDATLSYYASNNAVYLNGAGANGWLRLNASGLANDRTAINLFGQNQGDLITFKTATNEVMRIANDGALTIKPVGITTGLRLQGRSSDNHFFVQWKSNDGSTTYGSIGSNNSGRLDYQTNTHRFTNQASNDHYMTLDSTGLAVDGDITLTSGTSSKPKLTITNTNADSTPPYLILKKDSASPADNDEVGRIYMYGDDDAGNATEAFLAIGKMTDVSNGSEDSSVDMYTYAAGAQTKTLTLKEGRVGIGTTNPGTELQIGDYTDNAETLTFATASDQTGRINFYNNNSTEGASIRVTGGGAGAKMYFANRYDTDADRVIFDLVNGRVGIGTDNPQNKLHLTGLTNTDGIKLQGDQANVSLIIENDATNGVAWDISSTGGGHGYGDGALHFGVAFAPPKMKIQSDGKVGIGTNSPTYTLDVAGDIGVNEYIYHNDDTNTYMRFQTDAWLIRAGGDDRIYVDGTNGRVGIGTNSPTKELDVRGGSGSGTISHAVFTGTTGRGLEIRSRSDIAGGQHSGTAEINAQDTEGNGGQLAFSTGGTVRAFLNHTGLMVGAASGPDTQFHVKATNNSAGDLWTAIGPGNVPSITVQNAGTTNNNMAAILFKDNSGHRAGMHARFVSHTGGDQKTQLRFSVTGAGNTREKMCLTEDGHLLVGQMASVGSGSPSYGVFGSTSGNATLTILTSSSGYGYLNFADGFSGASADPGYIRYNHNQNDLYTNRNFSGPSFSSDISRKENITDITDGWSVIKDLRPRAFDWKKDELEDAHLHGMGTGVAGFIAQELETVLPNEVHGVDGEKGIAPFGIIAYLVKTVQELEARIKDLEG